MPAPADFRWSFSQWESYDDCPAKWKFQQTLKQPRLPPGPAAARGLDMHDRVENYILGNIDLPAMQFGDPTKMFGDKKPAKVHEAYIPIIDAYKNHPNGDRYCEKKVSFDNEWFCNGSTAKTGGCRMVLDAVRVGDDWEKMRYLRKHGGEEFNSARRHIVRIAEWKSGSPKDRHKDQRHLYSIPGLKLWLGNEVEVTTYYLEHHPDKEKPVRLKVVPDDLPKLIAKWTARSEEMSRNQMCAPRPGHYCNWCDFAKRKGGPCQFGG